MFTRSDLSALMDAAPPVGVSIFLPTHVRGAEIRQDPIRLRNLAAAAREELLAAGLKAGQAGELLEPAARLIEDYMFWRYQDQGLAVFLGGHKPRWFKVPLPLAEQVVVGRGFHVRPLLPMLAADGSFHVLTITADRVRLFDASRFALAEAEWDEAPESLDEVRGAPDYENPVQAAPVARPNTASINISHAQVYGDSPEEWRKGRLLQFVERIASALQQRLASEALSVVLVADAEVGGHFQKLSTLGPKLAGVIEANPESMDERALHEAASAIVCPRLDADRAIAVERFAALFGSRDPRAATDIREVVRATHQGRVDTLLLAEEGEMLWGSYDKGADEVATSGQEPGATGRDLLDEAAVQTLQRGGDVYVVHREQLPADATAAAVLRY